MRGLMKIDLGDIEPQVDKAGKRRGVGVAVPRLHRYDIAAIATEVARQLSVRMDVVMNLDQCAEYLGITRAAVTMRARRGQLPYHRRGGKMYFSRYEVNNYLLPEGDEE